MSVCAGIKRDGSRCTVTVEPPQTHCWWHSPEHSEERRRAAAGGGRAKANPLTKALHALLEDLTERTVGGSVPTARAAVAAQLVNTRIRLIEVERRLDRTRELEERVEDLHRRLSEARREKRWVT